MSGRALLAALLVLPVASCGAQEREQGVFITRIGTDTVLVERYERTADSLTGSVAARAPGGAAMQHLEYAAVLEPQGLVRELGVTTRIGDGPSELGRISLGADSAGAFVSLHQPGDTAPVRVRSVRGAVPVINVSIALLEQVVRRARNIPGDTVTVPILTLDDPDATGSVVTFIGRDSAKVATRAERLRLRIDAAGRILGAVDASRGLVVERVSAAPAGWLPEVARSPEP